ncbi:CHAD domain-containing protein [Conexibacter stalactiti]|uniref:CHAD domain-containing protein n=1 Tax=Conexibacter stalactiti TaxID=1940611 RepID=A0ABU4HS00_9ACTN|nr:CHAD domain-containing protein [Conexibacter stalactiti]MDW5596066.1 CHAD domain-containing protein [Conexibacter stalactiti]MEC5036708.1 CHAD domain-containing protein [Conexibacter stalactiti]
MSYRLSLADAPAASIRACAREQLNGAVRELESPGDDPAKAIHQARKHLKKTRALLRLVRPALGERAYRAENDALRDAAAKLSATRDADVLVATVDALAAAAVGRLPASDLDALRAALVAEAAAARAHAPVDGAAPTDAPAGDGATAVAAAVAQELRDIHARVDSWPLDDSDWETVVAGISRAYARGRDARALAEADPTVEHLHDWRKRVKDLWYHHRLLKPVWPAVFDACAEEAHVLSEQLGDDHDLAVLRARLEQGIDGLAVDLDPLLAVVEERRGALQAQARQLAARLYAEKPKAFERRVTTCVEAAVAETGAAAGA